MKKSILLVLLGLFTLSCQTQKISSTPSNDLISFKIVQINDVYEIDAINAGRSGGLARVAHIRDSIQKVNPNTFYFLAGDFLNPSLLGTIKVDGERLQGKQMVEVLNVSDLDLEIGRASCREGEWMWRVDSVVGARGGAARAG